MQSSFLLLRPSSSDGGRGLFLPSKTPISSFVGLWPWFDGRSRRSADRAGGPVAAANGEQDHYAVLGISRSASVVDIKRAYRLLARKYHPDVSKDLQANEVFKSIRFAYEVLSDEVSRARYDMMFQFPGATERTQTKWDHDPDPDEINHRWSELRKRMQYWKQRKDDSWYYERFSYEETSGDERGSFSDVLRFAFFTLFFMQTIGFRATLTICGVTALLDKQLDIGYKTGYMVAWLLGGRGGILLTLCIKFASWLCGKNSSSLVALVVIAMWVGAYLAKFAPLPQGAVLALLYMSFKLQDDLK
ncbi:uncharacterized protein [Typha latifolia]|uniref:uncharacterized protein n=1 Tax=Typha latifolia TaxID=4733 RepID=UPI003C2E18FC